MLITEFYANREVFVTGGTGFLGKASIEKLLRSCPKIKTIYIMLRAKKFSSIEQRLEELKKSKVFDRIHQECPQVLEKLHAIEGDSQELGLGISASDLELMKNVSIILHMAANVKFDNPLRNSVILNTRGTHELIKIAEKLKHLVVFMHCSTAYCNPFEDVVDEKVYQPLANWRHVIKMAEQYDDYTLNALCWKLSGFFPNSYTFTKHLSEQLILDYSTKLPMVIVRPSVVVNAYQEPVPGWIDNMNGPIALMVGKSVGVLPMGCSDPELKLDFVPVDMVTKFTVIATYKRGLQCLRKETIPNGLEIVNCASGGLFSLSLNTAMTLYCQASNNNPMENSFWYYEAPWLTKCYYEFLLNMLLLSIPLALVIDNILRLTGREPMLFQTSRRILYMTKTTSFYTRKEYKFINKNVFALEACIPKNEVDTFGILKEAQDIKFLSYFDDIVSGVKYNLFNQPPQATESARKRLQILVNVNRAMKLLFFTLFISFLWLTIISKL